MRVFSEPGPDLTQILTQKDQKGVQAQKRCVSGLGELIPAARDLEPPCCHLCGPDEQNRLE